MNIVLDAKTLNNSVSSLEPTIGMNSAVQTAENIFFQIKKDVLILRTTNLSIFAEVELKIIKMDGEEEKSFLVKGLDFTKLSKTFVQDVVNIEILEKTIVIKANKSKTELPIVPSEEFPLFNLEVKNKEKEIKIKKELFLELIAKTKFAVSTDDGRGIIVGEKFEIKNGTIRGVGIDGYRIAIDEKDVEGTAEDEFVIQGEELTKIQKVLSVFNNDDEIAICSDENGVKFSINNLSLKTKTLEGKYINYESIIPTAFKTNIEFDAEELSKGLKNILVIWPSDQLIKLEFKKNKGKLISNTEGSSKSNELEFDVVNEGEEISISFNSTYLNQIFEAIKEGKVNFGINEKNSPVLITGKGKSKFQYVILPVES